MSKYGDLIKKARETEPENQKAINPEDQITVNPENQKARKTKNQITVNPENHKSGLPEQELEDQITINTENQKARKPESQITVNPEDHKSGLPEQELEMEQMVNVCIKVPISQRRYWMSKAKEQGITVTSVIVEALTQKFGLPENQNTRKPNQ